LNFYIVNRSTYLVDLPGYGYAKVARSLREQWGGAIESYLVADPRVAGVLCLVDIRRDPTALDLDLQRLLAASGRPREVVLTKADKLGRGGRAAARRRVRELLELDLEPVAVSVSSGEGRNELLQRIDALVDGWRQSNTLNRST
jgi:GTP-binding protein